MLKSNPACISRIIPNKRPLHRVKILLNEHDSQIAIAEQSLIVDFVLEYT
jgi:hypothetical protein